jgi:hypothetical protein
VLLALFLKQGSVSQTWIENKRVNNPLRTMDYRREYGCFPVSTSCVTISNPNALSSRETWMNVGIRSWKPKEWVRCQKAVGGIYFTQKGRHDALQTGLLTEHFNSLLKRGIFKRISWLNDSFVGGFDLDFFFERGIFFGRPTWCHQFVASYIANFFSVFTSIIYATNPSQFALQA